jgi:hypothetical protein
MNHKLINTLTLVCLVLLFIITLEWLYADYAQKQLLNPISSPAKPTSAEEMPTIDLNTQSEESYADLVNRPLFVSGRKPVAETEQAQTQAQATGVTNNNFDWLLNGIYTTKKGLTALLTRTVAKIPPLTPNLTTAKTPNDKYRKVVVGDSIDNWKVAEIHANEIMVTQGSTQNKLLLRKPKAKETQEQNQNVAPNSSAMRTHTPASSPPAPAEPQ